MPVDVHLDTGADTCAEIRRGVTRMARRLRSERPAGSLSSNAISVLGHLHRHGPSTPGEIAAAEHHKAQSLTRVFAELQFEGLISRRRSDRDGRESVLSLTRAGRHALASDMQARDQWLQAALGALGETEVDVLLIAARILERLAEETPELAQLARLSEAEASKSEETKGRRIAS